MLYLFKKQKHDIPNKKFFKYFLVQLENKKQNTKSTKNHKSP